MKNENWRVWNHDKEYGELLFKRATGELEEMESSKAVCEVLSALYQKGMSLVDIGCGAGHYLRSLKKRLDKDINYTGIDATEYYVNLARKAFPQNVKFQLGDIFNLPLEDNSFDIVMNNNVLLHLPPPPQKPLGELIRISKKYIVIRTVFGERNYIIKELRNEVMPGYKKCELPGIIDNETLNGFNYFNMYTKDYLQSIIYAIDDRVDIKIIDDTMWKSFDNTVLTTQTGTKVLGDYQISGNLLLNWKFIVITKP